MSRRVLILIFFLLLANFAIADSITNDVVNDQISPYDYASYKITIFNEKNVSDKYTIVGRDVDWSIQTEPLTDYTTGVNVPAYSNYTIALLAKPREQRPFVFGKKSFQVDLRSEVNGRVQTAILSADVRQDLIKSPFSIQTTLQMPEVLDPVRTNSVKVLIKNNNLLNISGLDIELKSSFFDKTATVSVGPEQEKTVDFSVNLDKDLPPQKDSAVLTVKWKGEIIKTIAKDYSVSAYGKFSTEKTVKESLLSRTITVKYVNEGNSEQTENVLIDTTLFDRIFTSTNPKTSVAKVNGLQYITKELTLGPRESATIVVRVDYMPLVYIAIIIVALLILYLVFRAPLISAKEARDVIVEEGGIRGVSVTIKVKNRSGKPVHNVKVIDRIPNITQAELRKSDVLRPDKTFHYEGGIVLQYSLHKMEPGEIRFITYHLKTKLGVVGDLRLKPVIVQYEDGKKIYSNPVDVYSP